ncbi:GatB/YqeY domain-containing protein [Roseibium sp. RKSG952]|uniref:GatB/YqeY domain-containing protein n=1 Tax=Roseibium sp. RKSG952 TaxID=2529384 RepID=UPI0012BC2F0F|nr:GatB/YqeY domain-containing protein [Roseibium sp. RKSG952]MTH99578.1 GatB/YqeY domain-containing protein [Roseibium sp. RKSG952]
MREQIQSALKAAKADGDKRRTATLRLIQTAIKDRDASAREQGRDGVSEAEVLDILQKMVRQRDVSGDEFEQSGQLDLAEQERAERDIIEEFLPERLDDAEMRKLCEATLKDIDAHGLRDIGRCMSELKARYPDKMDFVQASCLVKDLLRSEPAAPTNNVQGAGSSKG